MTRYLLLGFALLVQPAVASAPLPEKDGLIHHGVASCATSVCHGKAAAVAEGNIRLNEYHTWLREDLHSRAYKVLLNEQSRRIAKNLSLPNAQSAKICLDCHGDNVATDLRGSKFQITDGVGCEACHGGSENWLKFHTQQGATRAGNLAKGMYPTENPKARAKLCLSCHLGTHEKFAGHDLMGAGHPRLVFELETFTANQPAHYDRDADYQQRKGGIPAVSQWATGLAVAASSLVTLMEKKMPGQGLFPELAFFECHSCHHAMSDRRWQPLPLEKGVRPGDVHLNDSTLDMLLLVLEQVDRQRYGQVKSAVQNLHQAVAGDGTAYPARLAQLARLLVDAEQSVMNWRYSTEQLTRLRAAIVDNIGRGFYRDYTSAEQAFLALETISLELGDIGRYDKQLDRLYSLLGDEDKFNPSAFANAGKTFNP